MPELRGLVPAYTVCSGLQLLRHSAAGIGRLGAAHLAIVLAIWWLAAGCSHCGWTEEALHWLANAIDLGFVNHRFLSTVDPFLAAFFKFLLKFRGWIYGQYPGEAVHRQQGAW